MDPPKKKIDPRSRRRRPAHRVASMKILIIEWPLWNNFGKDFPKKSSKILYLHKEVSKWAETFENELSSQNGVETHKF